MQAIKVFSAVGLCLAFMPALATETLSCLSNDNSFVRCDLSQADQRDIRIKQVQTGNCSTDNAWGVDEDAIWVDKGCGAIFEYSDVATSNTDDGGGNVIIAPGFVGPYYGPGFYYGAGFYENNNWNNNDYCNHNDCNNHNQQHNNNYNNNHQETHGDGEFHGGAEMGGGGFHGGGGRR